MIDDNEDNENEGRISASMSHSNVKRPKITPYDQVKTKKLGTVINGCDCFLPVCLQHTIFPTG